MTAIDALRIYNFRDDHGHRLEMVVPYMEMCATLDAIAAMNPILPNDHFVLDTCRFCGADALVGAVEHDETCPWVTASRLVATDAGSR